MFLGSTKQNTCNPTLSLIAVMALAVIVLASCTKSESPQKEATDNGVVLASIGDFEVSERHFLNSFRQYFERSGRSLQVTEPLKRSILENELGIYTAVVYAKDRGWDSDHEGQRRLEKITRQVLMEEYERRFLFEESELTDDDLIELYYRSQTHIRASHIFARDRYTIDSLYQMLLDGHDFATLASENFESRRLRESGGDLGYFTVDEMDVAFERAAFRLQLNEISQPVRTSRGYSIIKVTDIITNPFLREMDFAVKKPRLRSLANKQRGELLRRGDIYEKVADFNLNRAVLQELWAHIGDDIRQPVTGDLEEAPFTSIPPQLGAKMIANNEHLTLSVNQLMHEVYFSPDQARAGIQSFYQFLQMAEGISYRVYATRKIQQSDRIDRALVEGTIERTFQMYLSNRLNNYIKDQLSVPESVIAQEFETHRHLYQHPVELNLAEIIIDDWDKAEYAWNELQAGRPFLDVLHEYGFDEEAKQFGGELGYIPVSNFGGLSPALAQKKIGDYAGPFEVQKDVIFIFKVLGRREARPMTLEEASQVIEAQKAANLLEEERARILAETRRKHNAMINYAKLSEVTLSL